MRSFKLNRALRDVRETVNPASRAKKIARYNARAEAELAERRERRKKLAGQRNNLERHPGNGDGSSLQMFGLAVLAMIVLIADVPVQLMLNSAALPDVAGWKILLGSVGLALLIAGAVHGLLLAFAHDEDRPARSIRLTLTFSWVVGLAAAIAGGIVLFARLAGAEEAAHLTTAVTLALWVAAEGFPVAGGGLSSAAHFLAYPTLVGRKSRRNDERIADLEEFLTELDEERTLEPPAEASGSSTRSGGLPGAPGGSRAVAAAVAIALAGGLLFFASPASAQPPTVCAVWVDRTLSVDSANREEALAAFKQNLPDALREFGCTQVLVGTFADEGIWAPRRWLAVPQPPVLRDCTNEQPALEGTQAALNKLKGFRDHFQGEAVRACEAEYAKRRHEHDSTWTTFLADVYKLLDEPQLKIETATNIVAVLQVTLAKHTTAVVMVLTDALDTAHRQIPRLNVPSGTHVIFVLIPAGPTYGGARATEYAVEVWRRAVPGLVVLPYVEFSDPMIWRRVQLVKAPCGSDHARC